MPGYPPILFNGNDTVQSYDGSAAVGVSVHPLADTTDIIVGDLVIAFDGGTIATGSNFEFVGGVTVVTAGVSVTTGRGLTIARSTGASSKMYAIPATQFVAFLRSAKGEARVRTNAPTLTQTPGGEFYETQDGVERERVDINWPTLNPGDYETYLTYITDNRRIGLDTMSLGWFDHRVGTGRVSKVFLDRDSESYSQGEVRQTASFRLKASIRILDGVA